MTELDGEFMVTATLSDVERRVTKRGNEYGHFDVTDATGVMDGFLSGRAYKKLGHLIWDDVEVDLLCMVKEREAGPPMLNVLGMAPAWAGVSL